MRALPALLIMLAAAPAVAGDAKIDAAIKMYDKELTACRTQLGGLVKIGERGKPLATSDTALATDLATLATAQATVQVYCDDLAAALEFLRVDPKAKYKAVEKELDKRDSKVRAGRKASKKALEQANALIGKLVPKINAQLAKSVATKPSEKKVPGQFPSGRTIDLPVLAGTWKISGSASADIAEYTEANVTSTVTVRGFVAATCDQQRKSLSTKAEKLEELAIAEPLAAHKPAWYVQHTVDKRVTRSLCVPHKNAGWVATIETTLDAKHPLELVVSRMLDAQRTPTATTTTTTTTTAPPTK